MKNKFYHYGDSFATCDSNEVIFSKYISEYFNLDWVDRGFSGSSNYVILSNIIKDLSNFKSGDKVLIGFTFFTRGEYIDKDDNLISTNIYYNDMGGSRVNDLSHQEKIGFDILDLKRRNNILDYLIDYSWDYYVKLFKYSLNPIISYLINIGIDVRYFYIKKDTLTIMNSNGMNNDKPYVNFLPDVEINLNGFYDFITMLQSYNWMEEESVHYTWNIQNKLANIFIKNW